MRNKRVSLCTLYRIGLISMFVFCLTAVFGTIGCSDSGGKSKPVYYMTGYQGIENSDSATTNDEELTFYSEFPWFVNLTFQVFDEDEWGDSGLKIEDFDLLENSTEVDPDKSEMNIRQRNSLPPAYDYTLKTVLLIDNTPSASLDLEGSIEAARVVLDNIDELQQQEIAIVAFDEAGDPILVHDFTGKVNDLNDALTDLKPSFGTSNFYGAVIASLSLWEDEVSSATTSFVQGVLVAISDGLDTSNLYDVNDALAARGNQQVITIAVGPDIPADVLTDLEQLGNAGYYHVINPDLEPDEKNDDLVKNENLCENLLVVQSQMLAYADAFYWLQYKTFSTSIDANLEHSVVLSIRGNGNKGVASALGDSIKGAKVSGVFSSADLFSGQDGIYFDASAANPAGLDEKIITIEPGQDEVPEEISVLTFSNTGNNPSQYQWQSNDETIIMVTPDEKDSSKAILSVGNAGQGHSEITVTDTQNNVTAVLPVTVEIRSPAFEFLQYVVDSKAPWFVDATFQVRYDLSENNQWDWVTDLIPENFNIIEGTGNNKNIINPAVSEVNLRKRNQLPSDFSYSLKTVLLIDNTPSIDGNLLLIKEAAKTFVDRAYINDPKDDSDSGAILDSENNRQQEIAIFSFDEYGDDLLVQPFTSDIEVLHDAIDSIAAGYSSTDFYGGMIESLKLWEFDASPWDDNNLLQQGVVVALSDGWNSFQGFIEQEDVLNVIESENKQVISVSVGNDLVSRNSNDLVLFGNAGYYSIPDPEKTQRYLIYPDVPKPDDEQREKEYTDLEKALVDIQDDIIEFANSFYWLEYQSDVTPAVNCDMKEELEISIKNNKNAEMDARVTGSFESCEFFQGDAGLIYLNSTPANPQGNDGPIEIVFDKSGILYEKPTYDLKAFTYAHENAPDYEWQSANENIVKIELDERFSDNSRAKIVLPENAVEGTAELRIFDRGNGNVFKFLTVNVVRDNTVVAYYPFTENAMDTSGNNYHGQVSGALPALDRFGECDCAFSFDGNSYIALPLHYGVDATAYTDEIDEITVCAWVKGKGAFNQQTIFSFDGNEYWELSWDNFHLENTKITYKSFDWITSPVLGDINYLGADIPLNYQTSSLGYMDGKWHFVCGWYKVAGGGETLVDKKIYVDGELKDSDACHNCQPLGSGVTRYGFIGTGSLATTFDGLKTDNYFNGLIDDVLIVNRALTDEEILDLYHRGGWGE